MSAFEIHKKNTSTSHTSPAIYNVTAVWSSGFQQRTGEGRRSRVEFKIGEHVAAATYDLEDHPRTDLDMWIGSPPMKISHFHGHLEGEGMQIYGHFEGFPLSILDDIKCANIISQPNNSSLGIIP